MGSIGNRKRASLSFHMKLACHSERDCAVSILIGRCSGWLRLGGGPPPPNAVHFRDINRILLGCVINFEEAGTAAVGRRRHSFVSRSNIHSGCSRRLCGCASTRRNSSCESIEYRPKMLQGFTFVLLRQILFEG